MKSFLLLVFGLICNTACGSRILLYPCQGKSHMLSMNIIGHELKGRGHEVYTVAEDFYKGKEKMLGGVGLQVLHYKIREGTNYMDSPESQQGLIDLIMTESGDPNLLANNLFDSCKNMLADEAFLKTVSSLKFDLVIVQSHIIPCAHMLPHIMKIPHITFLSNLYPDHIAGSVDLPSYQPTTMFVPESMPMEFLDRLKNTLMYLVTRRKPLLWLSRITGVFPQLSDTSVIEEFKSKGLVADHIHAFHDILDETQLYMLANTDITVDYPKPWFPNVISLEGLSAVEAKPLSKELEDLVQSAEHGVIVVSFGSNVQHLPDEVIIKLVNAFRKRKELFLMRFAKKLGDEHFEVPPNVQFMSWLPQNDLLAHNKTKLFITHGGMFGLHETIYQGVPMLCVPLFGDQPANAKTLKAKGYGLYFRITNFTEEEVLTKIDEVISNPSYREKTQRAGQIMRHRPMTARQTAAFWIEHVLQFGGEHLRPSVLQLTWWEFYCLDTLGLIVFTVVFILWMVYKLFKVVFKMVCGSAKPKPKSKKRAKKD